MNVLLLPFVGPISALCAVVWFVVGFPCMFAVGIFQILTGRAGGRSALRVARDETGIVSYFYGPALTDFRLAMDEATGSNRELLTQGRDFARPGEELKKAGRGRNRPAGPVIKSPRLLSKADFRWAWKVGWLGGMWLGAVGGAVLSATVAVGYVVTVYALVGAARMAGPVLRLVDSALLRFRNIKMTCPLSGCYQPVRYPWYECPSPRCDKVLTDVRAGRYGLWQFTCTCGEQVPTLLMRRPARLNARCPNCRHALPYRPGAAPEIVLPFIGATGAGKTQLMSSTVLMLCSASRLRVAFADAATRVSALQAAAWLSTGTRLLKTPAERPQAWLLRVRTDKKTRLLQLFDVNGEVFRKSLEINRLGYLAHARIYVLVIDPLALDDLWLGLPASQRAEFGQVRSDEKAPELAYQRTLRQLEEKWEVRLRQARLAVVISRGDLLSRPEDEDAEEWAVRELGLGNLIRSARHQFADVRVFMVGSVIDRNSRVDPSVETFAEWALAGAGWPDSSGPGPVPDDSGLTALYEDGGPEVAESEAISADVALSYQLWRRLTLGLSLLACVALIASALYLIP